VNLRTAGGTMFQGTLGKNASAQFQSRPMRSQLFGTKLGINCNRIHVLLRMDGVITARTPAHRPLGVCFVHCLADTETGILPQIA
jgi:hypothetical protein